ncbi:MAG: sulfatase-like hydrolase/transferase, partial [candidate division KSB1 bacterium]|nr:sulfatase-like hydrolase/transferase [candidate division KSB1 bacterium]
MKQGRISIVRRFSFFIVALVVLLIWLQTGAIAQQTSTQPNLIIILTDDQHFESINYLPTIQKYFIEKGLNFQKAFATTALCCPSRSSILTGLYARNHGIHYNGGPEGGFSNFNDQSTLATWLHDAGYQTALVGKYLNNYTSTYIPPGWDEWQALLSGGWYYNYEINENGTIVSYGSADSVYSTDVLARKAVNFIKTATIPFFLYFSPIAPHEPATPAARHDTLFSDLAPYRPPNYNEEDISDKPSWMQNLPLLSTQDQQNLDAFRLDQIRTLMAVDEAIQSFIDALTEIGQLENTIMVFTSDHGLGWGEHRYAKEKAAQIDEVLRVPFLVYAPGIDSTARSESTEFALNIDIASTFAEFAGVTPPDSVDGVSLVPAIKGTGRSGRNDFVFEQWEIGKYGITIPSFQGLRNHEWKYVEYANGEKELYDLFNDPHELTNVAGDSAYIDIQSQMAARLHELLGNQPPNAVATVDPDSGEAPLTVQFTGSNSSDPDGTIQSYDWDFGDGGTSTLADPQHTYQNVGNYTARLIVTDDASLTDTAYVDIIVTDPGPQPPQAPTTLTATAVDTSRIDLSWTDNANNEDGFKIERKDPGSTTFVEIAQVGANVTNYSDTGLNPNSTYTYRVLAFNADGNSGYS